MANVKITRISEYANRIRNIKLFVDGKEIDVIANGQTKDLTISGGTHTLQAKIDWCTSNKVTFTVGENESKTFTLSSFAKHSSLGIFAAIYYITFGANKYLNLTEA